MPITQKDVDAILADETKVIIGPITWHHGTDSPQARQFRIDVDSEAGYPLFIQGRYNPVAGKLSYSLILRGVGRIYGLDLGMAHRNPDGIRVSEKHKNRWREGSRDKWAYVPRDITEPWNRPVEVWRQFCDEARLRHQGIMSPPITQGELPL